MQSRDEAEAALAKAADDTTKTFLRRVLDAVLAAIRERRFDDAQPVLALGVLLNWWTDDVQDRVVLGIQESWRAAFAATAQDGTTVTARSDAMAFHIAAVRDRLSRGALPEIPERAFDEVRLSQSSAALGGWGVERQSRDIAERLAWEPDKSYWEQQKADAEARIDAILDPLGRPGTPARTYAHRNDPEVRHWQAVRAGAVDKINEHRGDWQVRSERIARTEATAAWNSGALAALAAEGRTHKKWVATTQGPGARRTRESHRLADGQVVPLSRPFKVGESLLMMPGDPAAPPWEVVNCRCTVVGADEPARTALTAGGAADQLRVPKGNGPLSGRWVDMPGAVVADFIQAVNRQNDTGPMGRRLKGYLKAAEALRPEDLGTPRAEEAVRPLLDEIKEVLDRNADPALPKHARERRLPAYQEAHDRLTELLDLDMSLYGEGDVGGEEGDVGGGDAETVQVGADTAVSPEAAAVLDEWVQLGGSFTRVSPEDRALLAREVEARGERAPTLYRGANLGSVAALRPGRAVDLGVASTSEDEGSALPYAENGDGHQVLLVIEGARGLNVQDRAEAESGFAEAEWVVAGQFCVQDTEEDGDLLVATLRPCSGGRPVSLTAAGSENWRRQVRVPRGNGEISGRWVDMPGMVVASLLDDLGETAINDRANASVESALESAKVFDPARPSTHERGLDETADDLERALSRVDTGDADSDEEVRGLIRAALEGVRSYSDVDWSLFDEATDIAGGRVEAEATDVGAGDAPDGWYSVLGSDPAAWHDDDNWLIEETEHGEYVAYTADLKQVDVYDTLQDAADAVAEAKGEAAQPDLRIPEDETPEETLARTEQALADLLESAEDVQPRHVGLVAQGMAARIDAAARTVGLRATLQTAEDEGDAVHVVLLFEDQQGTRAGVIERRIYPLDRSVTNEFFQILPDHQGAGLGAAITASLEAWYEDSGVETVKVHANIDVGGYTWARLGFDRDPDGEGVGPVAEALAQIVGSVEPPDEPAPAARRLWHDQMAYLVDGGYNEAPPELDEDRVREVAAAINAAGVGVDDETVGLWVEDLETDPSGVADQILAEYRQALPEPWLSLHDTVQRWAEAVHWAEQGGGDVDGLPTMYELATFGQGTPLQWEETAKIYRPGAAPEERVLTTWPGKQALLGSNWHGVKYLGDGGRW